MIHKDTLRAPKVSKVCALKKHVCNTTCKTYVDKLAVRTNQRAFIKLTRNSHIRNTQYKRSVALHRYLQW